MAQLMPLTTADAPARPFGVCENRRSQCRESDSDNPPRSSEVASGLQGIRIDQYRIHLICRTLSVSLAHYVRLEPRLFSQAPWCCGMKQCLPPRATEAAVWAGCGVAQAFFQDGVRIHQYRTKRLLQIPLLAGPRNWSRLKEFTTVALFPG